MGILDFFSKKEKQLKVFYHNYDTNEGIDANKPQKASLELALDLFETLNQNVNNFFGIIDDNGKTIQFIAFEDDDGDDWCIDIPDIEKNGFWQKVAGYDECTIFIEEFYNGKIDMTDFEFEPDKCMT